MGADASLICSMRERQQRSEFEPVDMIETDLDDYDLVRFVFDLSKKDTFGIVMRAQVHIAHELRRFILTRAVSPKHAKCDELDFEETARLAIILGLDAQIKPALATLGALQKRFARSLDVKFDEQEASNFYNALCPELKTVVREGYEEFRVKENLVEFKRQPPRTRLVYFLLGIWSFISAERKHPFEGCLGTLPAGYLADLEARQANFFELLDGEEDHLGMIIRGHIHLEHELREFIFAASPQPSEIKLSQYDYAGMLGLALTMGLSEKLEAGLAAVGNLRNRFAHRLEVKLTEAEASQIFAKLDSQTKADAVQAWAKAFLVHPDMGRPKELLKSSPKDLVATCIAMLWIGVVHCHVTARADSLRRT